MKPDEFWCLTPFEVYEWSRAQAKRECREYKLALFGAWHSAIFQRQKKMPDLNKIMNRLDSPVPQQKTPDELRRKVQMLAVAFGGNFNG